MATCSFTTVSGRECFNKAVSTDSNGLPVCHCKGHWSNKYEYDSFISRSENNFNNETIPINPDNIINTQGDGACFYRVCAKYIQHHSELFPDISSDIIQCEDKLAAFIQQRIVKFIEINHDSNINQLGCQTFYDAIPQIHEDISSFEEYCTIYQKFAGDPDYIIDETIVNGKKKKCKIPIPDRWGSTVEQIAFSMIYDIKINVYLLQKFDKRRCKVIEVTKKATNIRIKMFQQLNPEIEGLECNKPPLNIILQKQSVKPHYIYINY